MKVIPVRKKELLSNFLSKGIPVPFWAQKKGTGKRNMHPSGEKAHMMGQEVTRLPVKQASLDFPKPNMSTLDKLRGSCVITFHLVAALWGRMDF